LSHQIITTTKKQNKMNTFRKVTLEISRGNGYGQYIVSATYRGKQIQAHTTDSEAFDWLNDDSNKAMHQQAKKHCYNKIVSAYQNQY
jgi:hypothetical protein